jgi:hypothetical protein
MPRTLELNCLVQGDNLRNAFLVKICSHESVGTLKQAIRKEKEPAFDRVPADTFVLWKISIPVDGPVKQDPRILDLDEDQSLMLTNRLSKLFSDALEEEHIYIVVHALRAGKRRSLYVGLLFMALSSSTHSNPSSGPPSTDHTLSGSRR